MAISMGICLLDQISKFYIVQQIAMDESVTVIPHFFSLVHVRNPGVAFGWFADQSTPFRQVFFVGLSIGALLFLITLVRKIPPADMLGHIAIALLFGGACGNLLDRVRLGEVVDFLDFYIGRYHWYAFNVADSAITTGLTLFAFYTLFSRKTALS